MNKTLLSKGKPHTAIKYCADECYITKTKHT